MKAETSQISINIPKDMKRKLKVRASEHLISQSDLARIIFADYLERSEDSGIVRFSRRKRPSGKRKEVAGE